MSAGTYSGSLHNTASGAEGTHTTSKYKHIKRVRKSGWSYAGGIWQKKNILHNAGHLVS
jgi:hypothetical protein